MLLLVLKRYGNKVLGQMWGVGKLQASLFCLYCHRQLKSERDAFIHVPSFSFNEVKQILESGILAYRNP
jgi:hypothetical protein